MRRLHRFQEIIDLAFMLEPIKAIVANRKQLEDYLEISGTGNTPMGAYVLALYFGSSPRWAERVIERATNGNPGWVAYRMCRDGLSSREWAERVIENATTGYPALAAYLMASSCGSSKEWAGRMIAAHEN